MRQTLPLLFFVLLSTVLNAQHWCGTKSFEEVTRERTDISSEEKNRLISEHQQEMLQIKEKIDKTPSNLKDGEVYVIPVVFHIVHNFGPENISDEQIYDQLRIMNDEYRHLQAGKANIRDEFKGMAADSRIEFRLATKDPQGKCTNGIVRHANPNANFTAIAQIQRYKPEIFWPTDKYLNCMIVGTIESSGGGRVLGYAQFPFFGADNTDGLVMVHDGTGSIGTGSIGRSSVTTHEVGHWLGLYHTWGKQTEPGTMEACNDDDDVEDTPNTKGSPSICDLNEKSCGVLANVQNYMDYSYCDEMFTNGQRDRMHYFLKESPRRKSLWQPENVAATGTDYVLGNRPPVGFCKADFNHNASEPKCVGTTIKFGDASYEGVTSWKWSFPGGQPSISAEKNPTVVYSQPGVYSASLLVSDGNETKVVTKENIVKIYAHNELGTLWKENFESVSLENDDDFSLRNVDEDITFVINENVGYNSSRSIYINNYILPNGRIDGLISNTIDLSSTTLPRLTFKYAFAPKDQSTYDELNVFVSVDCGVTWTKRKTVRSSTLITAPVTPDPFVPSSAEQWKETFIDLPQYRRAGLRVKFEWTSGGGNNMYIDNISIADVVGLDDMSILNNRYELYPNPAAEQSEISFSLNADAKVGCEILDVTGKLIQSYPEQIFASGDHNISLTKGELRPGVYLVKITENGQSIIKKLVFN